MSFMRLKSKHLFPGSLANSETPKRRHMARIGRDGKAYFKTKPLSAEQVQLIRDMVKLGHAGRSIARTIGRSLEGTQKILRRMGLKTVFKAKRDAKNDRRRQSIEARDAT